MDGSGGKGGVESILPNHKLGKILGIGSFGKVKMVEHTLTGHNVSMKIISSSKIKNMYMEVKGHSDILSDTVRFRGSGGYLKAELQETMEGTPGMHCIQQIMYFHTLVPNNADGMFSNLMHDDSYFRDDSSMIEDDAACLWPFGSGIEIKVSLVDFKDQYENLWA
ncbi:unnamed protein product [Eruca vesicaria subsp. sativa]|uniref:Protein kinase domain-containing protein n=1 Tax=Eruca vesicaria subsp. sativa TaxID=29727 RepID=A0ABC8LQD0_ERUVS|nr:unnamed protein product [Eruca vesicaria subsp. sativa]